MRKHVERPRSAYVRAVGGLDPEPIEIASMQLLLSQIGRESEPELMNDRDRSSSSMALIELFADVQCSCWNGSVFIGIGSVKSR